MFCQGHFTTFVDEGEGNYVRKTNLLQLLCPHIWIDSVFSPVKSVIYFLSTEHCNLLAPQKHVAFKLDSLLSHVHILNSVTCPANNIRSPDVTLVPLQTRIIEVTVFLPERYFFRNYHRTPPAKRYNRVKRYTMT